MTRNAITSLRFARLCLLAVALFAGTVAAQPSPKSSLPFAKGEQLIYQTEFNKGLLRGVDVAEFTFRVSWDDNAAPNAAASSDPPLRIIGDVVSKGFFAKLFRVNFHEHIESFIGNNMFSPLRTKRSDEQGKRVRINEAVFDHQARKVTWTERDPNQTQALNTTTIDFQEPIQDVLSAIYFLRTQKLNVGETLTVPLTDSGRFYNIQVAVVERKKISSALGRVNAVLIRPAIFGENALIRKTGTLSIWITDDNRRIPIKAQLKVEVGTFDIKLKRATEGSSIALTNQSKDSPGP
jgi:hypothetical protein